MCRQDSDTYGIPLPKTLLKTNFDEKGTRKKYIYRRKPYGQPRAGSYVSTIWPGGRRYAGDAPTQLLCVTAVCVYHLMSDDTYDMYTNSLTSRGPRVNTSFNRQYIYNYMLIIVELQVPCFEADETTEEIGWLGTLSNCNCCGLTTRGLPPDQPPTVS